MRTAIGVLAILSPVLAASANNNNTPQQLATTTTSKEKHVKSFTFSFESTDDEDLEVDISSSGSGYRGVNIYNHQPSLGDDDGEDIPIYNLNRFGNFKVHEVIPSNMSKFSTSSVTEITESQFSVPVSVISITPQFTTQQSTVFQKHSTQPFLYISSPVSNISTYTATSATSSVWSTPYTSSVYEMQTTFTPTQTPSLVPWKDAQSYGRLEYQKGYKDGIDANFYGSSGYYMGYNQGELNGYSNGYKYGFRAAQTGSNEENFKQAYLQGESYGYNVGYYDGEYRQPYQRTLTYLPELGHSTATAYTSLPQANFTVKTDLNEPINATATGYSYPTLVSVGLEEPVTYANTSSISARANLTVLLPTTLLPTKTETFTSFSATPSEPSRSSTATSPSTKPSQSPAYPQYPQYGQPAYPYAPYASNPYYSGYPPRQFYRQEQRIPYHPNIYKRSMFKRGLKESYLDGYRAGNDDNSLNIKLKFSPYASIDSKLQHLDASDPNDGSSSSTDGSGNYYPPQQPQQQAQCPPSDAGYASPYLAAVPAYAYQPAPVYAAQPVYQQPAPQPVYQQPAPQPYYPAPAPAPQPAPQPNYYPQPYPQPASRGLGGCCSCLGSMLNCLRPSTWFGNGGSASPQSPYQYPQPYYYPPAPQPAPQAPPPQQVPYYPAPQQQPMYVQAVRPRINQYYVQRPVQIAQAYSPVSYCYVNAANPAPAQPAAVVPAVSTVVPPLNGATAVYATQTTYAGKHTDWNAGNGFTLPPYTPPTPTPTNRPGAAHGSPQDYGYGTTSVGDLGTHKTTVSPAQISAIDHGGMIVKMITGDENGPDSQPQLPMNPQGIQGPALQTQTPVIPSSLQVLTEVPQATQMPQPQQTQVQPQQPQQVQPQQTQQVQPQQVQPQQVQPQQIQPQQPQQVQPQVYPQQPPQQPQVYPQQPQVQPQQPQVVPQQPQYPQIIPQTPQQVQPQVIPQQPMPQQPQQPQQPQPFQVSPQQPVYQTPASPQNTPAILMNGYAPVQDQQPQQLQPQQLQPQPQQQPQRPQQQPQQPQQPFQFPGLQQPQQPQQQQPFTIPGFQQPQQPFQAPGLEQPAPQRPQQPFTIPGFQQGQQPQVPFQYPGLQQPQPGQQQQPQRSQPQQPAQPFTIPGFEQPQRPQQFPGYEQTERPELVYPEYIPYQVPYQLPQQVPYQFGGFEPVFQQPQYEPLQIPSLSSPQQQQFPGFQETRLLADHKPHLNIKVDKTQRLNIFPSAVAAN